MEQGKKDIAFFIHTLGRGGAELVLVNLLNGLSEKGYKVHLYTVINTGNLKDLVDNKVEVTSLFTIPKFLLEKNTTETGTLIKGKNDQLSFSSKLYMFLWKNFPNLISLYATRKVKKHDIYISYLEGPTQKLVSKIKTKSPKVAWVHVDLVKEKKSISFYKNINEMIETFNSFDYVVSVSEDVKHSILKYVPTLKKINVIHNVYDDQSINLKANKDLCSNEKRYFKKNCNNLVSVGRLSKQKGYDRLIEAVNLLKQEKYAYFKNINILIIGDGEERDNLLELIAEHDLKDRIKLLGFRENPYNFIKKSDHFICSSRTEGFSTVVVESLIIGKNILTTDCSGMREILDNGRLGLIAENSIDGIKYLIQESTHQKMNKNQLEHLTNNISNRTAFSKENAVETHIYFFENVMKGII